MLTAVAAKTAIPREWGLSLADSGGPCLFVTASRHRSGATNITLAVRHAGWSWGAFRTSEDRAQVAFLASGAIEAGSFRRRDQ